MGEGEDEALIRDDLKEGENEGGGWERKEREEKGGADGKWRRLRER